MFENLKQAAIRYKKEIILILNNFFVCYTNTQKNCVLVPKIYSLSHTIVRDTRGLVVMFAGLA